MLKFRLHTASVCAALKFAVCAAAAATIAATSFGATPARAEAVPFWEQSDIDAAKRAKSASKPVYKNAGKALKKYAAKPQRKKLGGYAAQTEPKRKKVKGVRVASLGDRTFLPPKEPAESLTGSGVRWVASSGCLDGGLRGIVAQVAANFGPVTVNSTCRNKGHNRAVGGARKSKHLTGDAVDFRVRGNVGAVYAYLKSSGGVGGLKHYGGGLFHIDNGERRSW